MIFYLAQITSNDTVFFGAVTTIGGAMASAIVFLFKIVIDEKKTTRADLLECREDRRKHDLEIVTLKTELTQIKAVITGAKNQ